MLLASESPLAGGPPAAESGPLLTGLTVPRPSAAASDNSHLMSQTNSLPLASQEMILGSGPMSRSSGPAESGPGIPLPREARGAARGAQAISTP
jgi:hypothetical protein